MTTVYHQNTSASPLQQSSLPSFTTIPRLIVQDMSSIMEDAIMTPPSSQPTNGPKDTIIQLKFYNRPVDFWKRRYKDREFWYKMSAVDMHRRESETLDFDGHESSNITDHIQESLVKIAVLKEGQCLPRPQEQFGHKYDPDEFVMFVTSPVDAETMTFMVDFYVDDTSLGSRPVPEHIGFCYILPSNLRGPSGSCTMPITGKKHLPIGQLAVEYLMIKPLFGVDHGHIHMSRQWKPERRGLDVGHRGAGSARRTEKLCLVENVLENTIASFNYAASHGADMVELDVQLSKDLVPIIYHDYYVNIAMKKKRSREDHEFLQIPVKDLSLEQLHLLKLSPVHKHDKMMYDFLEDDHQDNQPFQTLEHILEAVDPRCGFNVEIKYPMQRLDGTWDGCFDKMSDLNEYVDIILKVLFNHAKDRNIIISCFHPDVCAMIATKQTRYPLLFLTQGKTDKWPAYFDPRTRTVEMAAFTALSLGFSGVNIHAEDLLKDRSLLNFVKSNNLILFVWGDDLNDKAVIKQLKIDGVDGVVYDKIDEYGEHKEPIFIPDTSADRKALLNIIASSGNSDLVAASSAFSWASSGISNASDVTPVDPVPPSTPSTSVSAILLQT